MKISDTFNLWDNSLVIVSIGVSIFIAYHIFKLSKQLSSKEKYQHELIIIEELRSIDIYTRIILANVNKYHSQLKDGTNSSYYKQQAELYTIIPGYGLQVILRPSDDDIPVGLIPFEWIDYVRLSGDSEDAKPIIVCKFNGIRWYKRFKSPFKEINYIYENPRYKEGLDPKFMRFTSIKPTKILSR